MLGFLAIAAEPISAEWLAKLQVRKSREVTELVLNRCSRFLRCQSVGSQDRWAVIHQSFADFLHARKIDRFYKQRCIDVLRNIMRAIRAGGRT